ncbi:MAG: hypothetical protein JWO20_2447 [Candidatus Angelobacter sp.]|jgi:uncharacterized protein (TIGR02391 family)|nr:hypothetical protein [Candidatus Angelobacter sp.]
MAIDRKAMIRDLLREAKKMKLCGPSDDPDEITAVSSAYYHLIIQLQTHAARILPAESAQMLRAIQVEINDIYSVYEANAKLDALLPDILDALEQADEPKQDSITKWYLEVRKVLRDIAGRSMDALERLLAEDKATALAINSYLKTDYERLKELWNQQVEGNPPSNLARHIWFGMDGDYRDILRRDLSDIEGVLDSLLQERASERGDLGFEALLHPAIAANSYELYRNGHLRDSVLNSIVAIFDLIRKRTGIDADGSNLINKAFSLTDPYLILSELTTESGQNDQKGFMQIFSGSYQGIRNPKAHTLAHDLTESKAAQYLIFASLLARRVEEATEVKIESRVPASNALGSAPMSKQKRGSSSARR